MITSVVQRWRDRRGTYRPVGEVFEPSEFEVEPILADGPARAFVEQHHYSATYPAARRRFGLYWTRYGSAWEASPLVGVAVFSHPTNDKVLTSTFPGCEREGLVELGRLVLLDHVRANAESWMIARCLEALRQEGFEGVVSFSDPVPRTDDAGAMVFKGHIGNVYQASNAAYLGRATARTLRLLRDGKVVNARTLQKIRKLERGYRAAVDELVSYGARPPHPRSILRVWMNRQLRRITRPLPHDGNLKYAFGLTRSVRKALESRALPYLKFTVAP